MNAQSILPADWQPNRFATLIYVIEHDRVLLIEKLQGHGAGKVNAPGGHIEVGETPEECALRELFEEVGLVALQADQRGELKFHDTAKDFDMLGYVFLTSTYSGHLTASNEANPFWIEIKDIPYERMWEDDVIWLPRMLKGDYIKGEFVFTDDSLARWRLTT